MKKKKVSSSEKKIWLWYQYFRPIPQPILNFGLTILQYIHLPSCKMPNPDLCENIFNVSNVCVLKGLRSFWMQILRFKFWMNSIAWFTNRHLLEIISKIIESEGKGNFRYINTYQAWYILRKKSCKTFFSFLN